MRTAPRPHGPLSGRRTSWRRFVARAMARVNRAIDGLPVGPALHRYVQRGLEWTDVPVALARGGPGLRGMRIAFLSDIHAGSFMSVADLCRIFAEVQARAPDLVCLGGDLINTRERELLMLREPLQLLRAPLGVFAVPGNHDHFFGADIGLFESFLHEQGVQVLTNRGARVTRGGDALWVAGVDDLTEGAPDLRLALAGKRDDEPVLLLAHHPDFFFEAAAVGVDLTLSGHTHGGQAKILGWAPIRHSRLGYEQGLFEEAGCKLYVGRGVGVTFLPIRWGVRAEIPVVRLV
jgi:uncharacterized protein